MPNLLDRIKGIRKDAEIARHKALATEREEFMQIAIRDFLDKPKDEDAERLLAVMESLGLSDTDYDQVVSGIGRVCTTVGSREYHAHFMKAYEKAYENAQREMITMQCMADRFQREVNDLRRVAGQSGDITKAYREVKEQFPTLFDDDGSPDPQLRPLIEREVDRRKAMAVDHDNQANQTMAELIRSKCRTLKIAPPEDFKQGTEGS
ncbi:MAG: hypothetical protein AAFV88_13325 [Planctomycetota bacterium]